ncbi:MAG: dihydropteroate synthase [Coriobacteriia bacterium]|nr:dihydropteroate synthase [Coriobacteriia bacterium]
MAPSIWRCGGFTFALERPLVMGILNVTPDSFSDGGKYEDPLVAIARGRQIVVQGASIIDVGGESTRPGADEVSIAEEIARARPVVGGLARELGVPVSIDTRHSQVAEACLGVGAAIINDVSGFRDPKMVEVAAGSDAGVVVMHMLGEPRTMQVAPHYDDVVAEVVAYLAGQAEMLERAGMERERIAIDPGIGFGKTLEQNVELLRRLDEIAALGYPVLVGGSRKSMIGMILGETDPGQRLEGSLAVAAWAVTHGADIVRVHDVIETARLLRVTSLLAQEGTS